MASSDSIRIMCPNLSCRKVLVVPISARGKTVRCKFCKTTIRIPGDASPKPAGSKA